MAEINLTQAEDWRREAVECGSLLPLYSRRLAAVGPARNQREASFPRKSGGKPPRSKGAMWLIGRTAQCTA